uniref:DegT/DnrJ/EryC1/StrS family aminotransferase n=1 Tax=Ornithobacterium rhinotracheale TaxID=28251 RepID=UPI0039A47E1A
MEEYTSYLKRAYDNVWLTNRGELVVELEKKLMDFLGVDNLLLTTNGTLPIQIALKALNIEKDVITTPFSYVATTSSISWENCNPIFVDIDAENLTIDPNKIEEAITNNTQAIVATHVFGNPCDVDAIEEIALKHGLKVIYDAAHCFGVKYKEKSIFEYGDVSTCSFHATKIFHTGEGGCLVAKDKALFERLYYMHNFGHKTPTSFYDKGINAKMSELQAAMGLAVFDHLGEIFENRRKAVALYDSLLLHTNNLKTFKVRASTEWNYHYYPIILDTENHLLDKIKALNEKGIYPRRYFYPSLNSLNYVIKQSCPISESISSRILCLPLSADISADEIELICNVLNG